jgi:hypothetical protein
LKAPLSFLLVLPNPLSLSEERVRERFHATRIHYRLSAGINVAGVLALNLSRRDRNRADLSSDK